MIQFYIYSIDALRWGPKENVKCYIYFGKVWKRRQLWNQDQIRWTKS